MLFRKHRAVVGVNVSMSRSSRARISVRKRDRSNFEYPNILTLFADLLWLGDVG